MDALEKLYVGNFVYSEERKKYGLVVDIVDKDTIAVQYESEPFGRLHHEPVIKLKRSIPNVPDHF